MWLIIILVIGLLIILLESTLESIVFFLEKRGSLKTSTVEWFSNDVLQLQRMVHEELGLGDWSGCTGPGAVPVTKKGQLLGILNNDDSEHPRLQSPALTYETAENGTQAHSSSGQVANTAEGKANANNTSSSVSHGGSLEIVSTTPAGSPSSSRVHSIITDAVGDQQIAPIRPPNQAPEQSTGSLHEDFECHSRTSPTAIDA